MVNHKRLVLIAVAVMMAVVALAAFAQRPEWNARAAAAYLDGRQDWWQHWPTAQRDHDTACVSCHTAVPYALARPVLRAVLGERDFAPAERLLLSNVVKRVRMWREVEPFYPDQTRGLPKSSESRGTEAVMNALILATRDASTGTLSADARLAFTNMWALQFKAGELKGAWAWLNFKLEPWEGPDSAYFGASLAAVAVGTAPGEYASSPEIQEQLKLLRDYLQQRADSERLFNRIMVLWASSKVHGILSESQRRSIIDAIAARQQDNGGWSTSSLAPWKRVDSTELQAASDAYATGLIALALQHAGIPRTDSRVNRALTWLIQHQDSRSGMWFASSLNKQRDPASDPAKFMSDAATAYAAMALTFQ